jgi:hypothetical protein
MAHRALIQKPGNVRKSGLAPRFMHDAQSVCQVCFADTEKHWKLSWNKTWNKDDGM